MSQFNNQFRDLIFSPVVAVKGDEGAKKSCVGSARIAKLILEQCGFASVLGIGSAGGDVADELRAQGVDVQCVSLVSSVEFARSSSSTQKSSEKKFKLPFENETFKTVYFINNDPRHSAQELTVLFDEIYRVSRNNLFLVVDINDISSGDSDVPRTRSGWELLCFKSGFRKHPGYYKINDYGSLNYERGQLIVPFEKISAKALSKYPLGSLAAERGLYVDMMREAGERSDAQLVRYQWASRYVRPGDRVLDAACGLGYGGHLIRHLSLADSVVGIDGSTEAIDYANINFKCPAGCGVYRTGFLPEVLESFPDGSFELIISFETLEYFEKPRELLSEFHRLLTPGGRVVVSGRNDWNNKSGEDFNPSNLHVYDWNSLVSELTENFIPEDFFAQTASQSKVDEKKGLRRQSQRTLQKVTGTTAQTTECEWWLATVMKSPTEDQGPYREGVFANLVATGHPSVDYPNYYLDPWIVHSIINVGYRLKNGAVLEVVAENLMASAPSGSNDYAAMLCVVAYRLLESMSDRLASNKDKIFTLIDDYLLLIPKDKLAFRWRVSLLYVKAKILLRLGLRAQAMDAFLTCARHDVREFGIHLATKTTEAYLWAGKIALADEDVDLAVALWKEGVNYGHVLLAATLGSL